MGRRGPKAKQGKREPNGRSSRRPEDVVERHLKTLKELDAEQRETMRSGVSARVRLHGVSLETSLDQMAGSFVGRLRLAGQITPQQYAAAETFVEECRNYSMVVGAPRQPGAVDLNATHGRAADLGDDYVMRSITAYNSTYRALIAGGRSNWRWSAILFTTMTNCVLRDVPAMHLLPILREALDVLARHYKLDRDKGRVAA